MSPSLAPGTRLGPYEILGSLCRRMGEVYRAGTAASAATCGQVLRARSSPIDRLERFQREGARRAAESPTSIAIHDVRHGGDIPYIVRNSFRGRSPRGAPAGRSAPPRVVYAISDRQGPLGGAREGIAIET